MLTKIPQLLFGGDYNPEQWPRDVWDQDITLMQKAGVNAATLGVFAWAALERAEGVYDFGWMDEIIEKLGSVGINIVLATPSAATPAWLDKQYPDVRRCNHKGERQPHRVRVNYCLSSKVYRQRARAMAEQLSERYGKHPAVIAWHIGNEYHGGCWCSSCQEGFRRWLGDRYKTIENLNKAWWTAFWSHTYTSFDEIEAPQPWPDGEWSMQALWLEWRRFVGQLTIELYENEAEVIRINSPDVPCTHNMHALTHNELLTHWKPLAGHLSFISWDAYPDYQDDEGDIGRAIDCSFQHAAYRGMKDNAPYAMMESRPSGGPGSKQQRPGALRRTALQAIGNGSDATLFFQWRDGRGGSEKFHGCMAGLSGRSDTRMFAEISALGAELKGLYPILNSRVNSDVALIFDQEIHWALELGTSARFDERDYIDTVERYYGSFWKRGINCDVLTQAGFIATTLKHEVIIAPYLYSLRPGMAAALENFVKEGGTLLLTCWSGYTDQNDLVVEGGFPGPLMELAGVWSEELDKPGNTPVSVTHTKTGKKYAAGAFCDVLSVLDSDQTTVLATFDNEYYQGKPALTHHRYGKGYCIYVGFLAEEPFIDDMVKMLVIDEKCAPTLKVKLPDGVSVRSRLGDDAEYIFISNFSQEDSMLDLCNENLKTLQGEKVEKIEISSRYSAIFVRGI